MTSKGALALLGYAVVLASCGRAPREAADAAAASEAAPAVRGQPATANASDELAPRTAPASGAPAAPQPPAAVPTDARLDGFGPLRLGMTTADAVAAWPGLYADRPQRIAARDCDYAATPGASLPHFTLMFDDGAFVGYGGSNDDIAAPGGGKRGMREAALQALYGQALQPSPDRFAPGGKLLSLDASGVAPSRLVFVIRPDGVVGEWRVGLRPQVDYDEGCESDPG